MVLHRLIALKLKENSYCSEKSIPPMPVRILSLFCFCAATIFATATATHTQALAKDILIVNEDNDFYFRLPAKYADTEELKKYVNKLAGGYVTHFFMCPNGQRTSYASKVHEPIWEKNRVPEGLADLKNTKDDGALWRANCKSLADRGIDPYFVWTQRCRELGILPWISMCMNDVHHLTTPSYFRNTNFWRTHRELLRIPESKSPNR